MFKLYVLPKFIFCLIFEECFEIYTIEEFDSRSAKMRLQFLSTLILGILSRANSPLAAPIINPVGPFMPSTQPGYGSFQEAVTKMNDLTINLSFSKNHSSLNSTYQSMVLR